MNRLAPLPLFGLGVVAVFALSSGAGTAFAGDEPAAPTAAFERAATVRKAIPNPVDPEEGKPSLDFKFVGDLVQTGENAGSVKYSIDVGTFRDEPVWVVTEERIDEFGGSRASVESVLFLKRDLSLWKGEWRRTTPDVFVRLTFAREGDGFDVKREVTRGTADPIVSTKRLPAAADATFGWGARLIFLRYVPAVPAEYALPLVQLESAIPAANEHEFPTENDPLRLEVVGGAKYGEGKAAVDSWQVKVRRGRNMSTMHFVPKTRDLIGFDSRIADVTLERVVPKGQGGAKAVYEDDQPAKSWKAAFLKFGHGYHLAVEKWIDAAIHWETMYAYEIEIGGWPKERSIADFKKEYVAEFLKKSKHRTRDVADGLLRATLTTGEERHEKDGSVVIASHPEYGGSIYHFKAIDGVWYLFRIDQ